MGRRPEQLELVPEAAGGEGVAEAAQVAGEVTSRSRVGLCDDAARQGAVPPRFHTPILLHCAPLGVHPHGAQVHLTPSFSTEKPNGRGASGDGGLDRRGDGGAAAGAAAAKAAARAPAPLVFLGGASGGCAPRALAGGGRNLAAAPVNCRAKGLSRSCGGMSASAASWGIRNVARFVF